MSEEHEVSQIHTICRNCVFAKYDKNTQTGCRLNKLEDYKDAGIRLVEVTDAEDKEFILIDGRFCMFYRNEDTMANYPKDNWEEIVKLQTKVPYHVILIVNEDSEFKDIKESCLALKDQKSSPNLVTIVNKQYAKYVEDPKNNITPSTLLELLKNTEFHQYSLKNIYDQSMDDRGLIDLVFDSSKNQPYPFYVVFESGFKIPESFSEDLNNAILINMMQLGFVKPFDEINGLIANRTAHKKHGGNSFGRNLEDKILEFEDDGEKFIFEIGDICPPLKK